MNIKPVITEGKGRIFETILDYFKGAVADGTIKPGDRLLPERDLAVQFDVSRASLREVLRSLEMMGVLSVIPGKGTFVLPPETQTLTGLLGLILNLRPALSKDILEVRKIIECEAVRLTCHRASPEELFNIEGAVKKMSAISNDEKNGIEAAHADFEFHKGIIRATHNDFLIFLYGAIEILVQKSHEERWIDSLRYIPDAVQVITKAHEDIYGAIVRKNESMATELMRGHFQLIGPRRG
jgi:DNA-binding FadR family transcriptional regulator